MPENKKINLDAFLKRNGAVDNGESLGSTEVSQEIDSAIIASQEEIALNQVGTQPEEAPVIMEVVTPSRQEREALSDTDVQVSEENTDSNSIENTESASKTESMQESGSNKHSLSLDRLKTRGKSEEEITEDKKQAKEKLEIQQHLEDVEAENASNITNTETEEAEVFGNYESKFSSQGAEILKKLRMPRTRIGMLLSLSILCVGIIGTLMYINPETHSISNYKTSLIEIYKSSKSSEPTKGPTGEISNPISEEINRKIISDEIQVEEVEIDDNVGDLGGQKEEIKAKNLKNFLIKNYK